MSAPAVADLRYPIGKFQPPVAITEADRRQWIADLEALPRNLRAAVRGLTAQQLETPYRDRGWTVRQVVHHVPDSHLNAYTRFKLALTEEQPTIKPYDEKAWAELPDSLHTPIEVSLALLENVHARWVTLLQAMTPAQFERTFRHPEMGVLSLHTTLALYSWHSRHHVAHVTHLRQRMGW